MLKPVFDNVITPPSMYNGGKLPSSVRVTIALYRNKPTVIFSELASNNGPSVTNSAERLAEYVYATQVAHLFPETSINDIIWMERYSGESYKNGQREETFDIITFQETADGRLVNAAWRSLPFSEKPVVMPDVESVDNDRV